MVLITLGGLRADTVSPAVTPHLAQLAGEADWSGRAVAPSSWFLPTLATLATGLDPWLHGMVTLERTRSGASGSRSGDRSGGFGWEHGFPALAEAVGERGYGMSTYLSGSFLRGSPLAPRALGQVRPLRRGAFAEGHLASLGEAGASRLQLLWVQVDEPALPYHRRGAGAAGLPPSLGAENLEAWNRAPGAPDRRQRATLDAMYRLEAAHADARLGAFLEALRRSPAWDDTLLVVTALHGAAAGDATAAEGGRLGRGLVRGMLEVPLVVKLPRSLREAGVAVAAPPGSLVALGRVWPTLVAAVGGRTPPAVPPSLFRDAPTAALSELHLENGINEISLVETVGEAAAGDARDARDAAEATPGAEAWQLLWRARFAPPEAEFAAARAADFGSAGTAAFEARTGERPGDLFARLRTAYEATPPLTGRPGSRPELTLLRWGADGGVEVVEDAERTAAMARRLRRHWLAFQACERSPAAEAAHRAALRTGALAVPAAGTSSSFAPNPETPPSR